MKKIFSIMMMLLLIAALSLNVLAASDDRLVDEADLISAFEEDYLRNRLNEISDQHDFDVVIVTVPALNGQSAESYADDYYDYHNYRPDGVLLLVSIYDRYWHISTTGFGITAFTDAGLAYVEEQFMDDLSDGNYSDSFNSFVTVSEDMIIQAKNGEAYDIGNMPKAPFNPMKTLLISLLIGLVAGLIAVGILFAQLKTVRSQPAATQYVRSGSLELTRCNDLYLYHQIHRVKRETSSSGGSSTHRGSSGTSHGGRGGSF